jgi:hypothetical protein
MSEIVSAKEWTKRRKQKGPKKKKPTAVLFGQKNGFQRAFFEYVSLSFKLARSLGQFWLVDCRQPISQTHSFTRPFSFTRFLICNLKRYFEIFQLIQFDYPVAGGNCEC